MIIFKDRLPDIIVGFANGMILSTVIILWGNNSEIIQRLILVAICALSLFATWSEKYSNNGNNSSNNSASKIPINSKKDSGDASTES